ncbi:hypothetical protein BEN78_04660 [Xanthomonas citri pv. mangiferaeindicae]|nr:hypothetical protein BEN78_04660 [Xanthomonas citri pv. mangiferaeindicae]
MGRSKKVSDEELMDRLLVLIARDGPGLSFAYAAQWVDLAPATLVHRFGTREGMVESTLSHAWTRLEQATHAADAQASADPAGAVDLLLRLTARGAGEVNFSDGLLLLREDFRHPALRARGAQWTKQLTTALGQRLSRDPVLADVLGQQLASVWQGAIIWWGFTRTGTLEANVKAVLDDWCRIALRA